MINKNIDYALIGHNYLTLLLSLGLRKRGKSVLLLDDDRFNYGDFFTNSLTQLDLDFLQSIGESSQIKPLININNYVEVEERYFYFGKKQVKLGLSPKENFLEIMRKFPNFFSSDFLSQINDDFLNSFENEFFQLSKKVSEKINNNSKNQKMYQIFIDSVGPNLKLFFNSFVDAVLERNDKRSKLQEEINEELTIFLYLARGFYHSHFSIGGSRIELFHTLMCLISPYYRLQNHKLNEDLLELFKENGGEFKKLNLSDVKFHRGVVKGLLLESFEGHITPQKIIFVGGHPMGLPIKFERPKNIYNCLQAEVLVNNIPKHFVGKKIVFSSSMKISTGRPMFEADFFENRIELNIVVAKRNGVKVSFIEEQVKKHLEEDFKFLFPEYDFKILDMAMNFTNDIFIEESVNLNRLKDDFKVKNKFAELIFNAGPLIFNRPKNVHYLGPYNDGFLGTLSSLIEIRKWQERI
jgi:hypothetical protein